MPNMMTFELPASLSEESLALLEGLSPELDRRDLERLLLIQVADIGDDLSQLGDRGEPPSRYVESGRQLVDRAGRILRALDELNGGPGETDR